ncbi:MAG TPA: hypothetical protein VKZ58_04275 [Longimicrobiales bacterium]|nr:hypothetical protein [Longimicrobiales bacterium]
MKRSLLIAAAALFVTASALPAQSLFGTRGLGTPVAPVDARARALGGIGVGLMGMNGSLVNPAEIASIGQRSFVGAIQPTARTVELDGRSDKVGGTRFPLLQMMYPLGSRLTLGLGYGGFLDQSWGAVTEGSAVIDGQTITTRDRLESSGAIAQARLGAAYWLAPSLAVGVAAGMYTGRVDRTITREFPETAPIDDFRSRVGIRYGGPQFSAGLMWDPLPELRFGGAVIWSGDLEAKVVEGERADRTYRMPLQAAGGMTARLAPRLLGVVGARWAGWSVAAESLGGAEAAQDAWEFGGGVEWQTAGSGGRTYPVRLGFNYMQLPFTIEGDAPTEWSAALGLGARLESANFGPRAMIDLALERGGRGGASTLGLSEDFWRFTLSVGLYAY